MFTSKNKILYLVQQTFMEDIIRNQTVPPLKIEAVWETNITKPGKMLGWKETQRAVGSVGQWGWTGVGTGKMSRLQRGSNILAET